MRLPDIVLHELARLLEASPGAYEEAAQFQPEFIT